MIPTGRREPAPRHDQLRQAWAFLGQGRFQDARWAFGRILREEPGHHEARRGREQAKDRLAEAGRQAEESLSEAEAARVSGDDLMARRLAERALAAGADAERAFELIDRLPAAAGALALPSRHDPVRPRGSVERPPRVGWSRVGLVSFWVLAFGLIATGVASSWEQIVGRLASAPRQESAR